MSDKPTGVAAAHAAAWDIARQLEYAADTCLYEPAAVLMRNAKDEIERRRWIPVSERLPDRGMCVLMFLGTICSVGMLDEDGDWFGCGPVGPTHWMPLPAPPTDAT